MAESFEVSDIMPATPKQVFDAWLGGKAHALMTGAGARGRLTRWGRREVLTRGIRGSLQGHSGTISYFGLSTVQLMGSTAQQGRLTECSGRRCT